MSILDKFSLDKFSSKVNNNKQLLNEVEYDIENFQGQGLCYPPKPNPEVDNTN